MALRCGSIRTKLLVSTLSTFIGFVVVLYLVSTFIVRQKMHDSLSRTGHEAVQTFNTLLDQMIAEVEMQVHSLSLNSDIGQHLEQNKLPMTYIRIERSIITKDIKFLLFDQTGNLITTGEELPMELHEKLFRDYADRALAMHYPLQLEILHETAHIVAAAPILDTFSQVQGALVMIRTLDKKFLDQMKVLINADLALMIDPDRFKSDSFLEQHQEQWTRQITEELGPSGLQSQAQDDCKLVIPINNDYYYFCSSPLTDLDKKEIGTILFALSMKEFQNAFRQTIITLAICVLVTLVFVILVVIRRSRQTTEPLLKLAALTREMGQGKTVSFAHIRTGDEIETLAVSFQRLQEDLNESIRKSVLNKNLATLGRFSADVVHEIKNPLEGLKLLVNGLKRKIGSDEAAYHYVEEIDLAIRNLVNLIHKTLDFARITKPEKVEIDVNCFIEELVEQNHFGSRIFLSLPQNSPVLLADRDHLRRIISNLLTNACEAINKHGTVTVEVKQSPESVAIYISDTGSGIEPEKQQKIFEPFFSTKKNGHGLGLSIAYHLAMNNDLDLIYQPRKPGGSQFIVRTRHHQTTTRR